MIIKKQLISVLLCFVISFCLLAQAGCGISRQKKDIVEIHFWHTFSGKKEIFFNALVDTYNITEGKRRGSFIVSEYKSQDEIDEYFNTYFKDDKENVRNENEKPDCPEISVMNKEAAYMAMCRHLITYAERYLPSQQLSKYNRDFMQEGQLTGNKKTYIFPISKSADVVMINDGLWKQFGNNTNVGESDWETWDGILRIAEEYYKWSGGKALIAIESVDDFIFTYSAQQLPALIQAANKEIKINTNKETLRSMWNFYYAGVVKGYIMQTEEIPKAIERGDIAAYIGLPHDSSYFPETYISDIGVVKRLSLSIKTYPVIKLTRKIVPQKGNGVCVFDKTEEINSECYYFLNWLCTNENIIQLCTSANEAASFEPLYSMDATKNYIKHLSVTDYNKYNMISASVNQIIDGNTYAPTGFIGYNSFREKLTASLMATAREGRDRLISYIEDGKSYEEAIELVNTADTFEIWYKYVVALAEKY